MRFVKQVAGTSLTLVWKAAAAMIAGIIVARAWGPSAKGGLSVLVALGSLAVLLGSLGLHQSGIYFLGRNKDDRSSVLGNGMLVGIVGGILTGAVLAVVVLLLSDTLIPGIDAQLFLLFVLSVPFGYLNEFLQRLLLGLGRVMAYNSKDVAEGVGLIGGTALLLVVAERTLAPLVWLRVILQVVMALGMLLILVSRRTWRFSLNRALLGEQVRYGIRNYASSIMWVALLQSDIVLCNIFLGRAQTGIYSVAVSLATSVTILPGAVAPLLFQRVASDDSRERRISNTNQVLRIMTIAMLATGVALALTGGWLIDLLYGAQYSSATAAIIILCPGIFFAGMANLVLSFLSGEGSPPVVYKAPLAGFILNLGINLIVIPKWGIDGAAATSSFGYFVAFFILVRSYLVTTSSRAGELFAPKYADVMRVLRGTPEV